MQELNQQLKQDIEEACKKAGLTTPVEDAVKLLSILAILGWVWYKKKKAGEQREGKDE